MCTEKKKEGNVKATELSKILLTAVLSGWVTASFHPSALAADEAADSKAQIEALNARVAQLEKQLAQRQTDAVDMTDPLRQMQMIQRQMNQMFDDSFYSRLNGMPAGFAMPEAELKTEANRYVIRMELPGMTKDSISIEAKDRALTISGKQSALTEKKGDSFYHEEQSVGQFVKTMILPDDASVDNAQARYDKGVLEITIGRQAGVKVGGGTMKITVN